MVRKTFSLPPTSYYSNMIVYYLLTSISLYKIKSSLFKKYIFLVLNTFFNKSNQCGRLKRKGVIDPDRKTLR